MSTANYQVENEIAATTSRGRPHPLIPLPLVDCLTPSIWELIGIAALLLFYGLGDMLKSDEAYAVTQTAGPIWLATVLFLGSFRMLDINKSALWSGLFWFRISAAVYFGIGSILHIFFNEYTLERVQAFYDVSPAEIAKINAINSLSVLCVLAAAWVAGQLFPTRVSVASSHSSERFTFATSVMFLGIGYSIKYVLIVPQALGALEGFTFTGALSFFIWLAPTGLFLYTLWCLKYSRRHLSLAVIFVTSEMIIGFLLFSKSEVVLPLLMFLLAHLFNCFTKRRLFALAAIIMSVFIFVEPTTGYGRQELGSRYGELRAAGLLERVSILRAYFSTDERFSNPENFQGSLVRFAYIHSAAPAVAQYDIGLPGNSFEHILYILIPRALWPGKPVFDMGANYTRLISGTDTSSTWMGYFAEAYWNFGWTGIPSIMIPLGFVFVMTSRYALALIDTGAWMHLPVAFLGIWMGMRTDGTIVTDIASSVLVMIIFHVLASFSTSWLQAFLSDQEEVGLLF